MATNIERHDIPTTGSRLGADTRLKGNLRFSGSVRIAGYYEGQIEADGFLFVEEGAEIHADVTAATVVVGGTVHGNVTARAEVDMLPGCSVYGNVRATRVRIADGVVFEGRCEMLRHSENVDIFSAPLEQLRKQAPPIIVSE